MLTKIMIICIAIVGIWAGLNGNILAALMALTCLLLLVNSESLAGIQKLDQDIISSQREIIVQSMAIIEGNTSKLETLLKEEPKC